MSLITADQGLPNQIELVMLPSPYARNAIVPATRKMAMYSAATVKVLPVT